MDRRTFLQLASLIPVSTFPFPAMSAKASDRILVLVELQGGNDALNTLIPYANDAYHAARPTLAVPTHKVLTVDSDFGFHPALSPLMPLWDQGELAWVHGVGYPEQNRSHFRSIDIWESASSSKVHKRSGWVADILQRLERLQAISIGDDLGPFNGSQLRSIVLRDLKTFLKQARNDAPLRQPTSNPALAHIFDVQAKINRGAQEIKQRLTHKGGLTTGFPQTPFGQDMELVARLINSGISARAYKVGLGSFDTHSHQAKRHQRLLAQLAESIAAFEMAMRKAGRWQDILLLTYSEFGRRVKENGNGGTDHGAAAAHLLAGGAVRGGLHGKPPSLTDLYRGDLKFTTDFRQLYASVANHWWGVDAELLKGFEPLPLLTKASKVIAG